MSNKLMKDETGQRIAAALESMALAGGGAAQSLDAVCQALIDGTNTTRVFESWYPRAALIDGGSTDRYTLLERFASICAEAWKGKTYTLRSYLASVSSDSEMTPLDDLAKKTAGQLATEADEEDPDDWTSEDPMTWYIRANALSKKDGSMNVLAIEGIDDDFDLTGETAPVYTFALALWIKEWSDSSYDYISFRTMQSSAEDYYPDAADVGPDNEKRALTWHATFPGGTNSAGALTSGAGRKALLFTSAISALELARKVTAYEGLWNDCDTRWLLRMWQLRHFNLENSNVAEGCTSYNYQYKVAAAEEDVKRVLVTTAQGANFIEGSTVSVGDMSSNTSYDRGNTYMRNLAHLVKISSIETVTVSGTSYTALNLELDDTITTTSTTCVSTMPWHSGATEELPGHKDGCIHSLTAGKGPLRVAGVEVLTGAHAIGLDPLWQVTAGSASGKYTYKIYEQRDSEELAATVDGYTDTGLSYTDYPTGWNYIKAFLKTKLGVLFPSLIGGSSTTYYKSAFYGAGAAGVRVPWRFCNLNNGGNAGLAGGNGNNSPSNSNWNGQPRLCQILRSQGFDLDDMRLYIPAQAKISKTGTGLSGPDVSLRGLCAASSNKAYPDGRKRRSRKPLFKTKK